MNIDLIMQHYSLVEHTMNKQLTREQRLSMLSMGLAGECGELVEPIKKHLYHGRSLDTDNLVKEAGDVLWYLHGLLIECGSSLGQALSGNVDKLMARYPNGFVDGGGIR